MTASINANGTLRFAVMPTISFGTVKIAAKDQVYGATRTFNGVTNAENGDSLDNYSYLFCHLADYRSDSPGWKLQVSQTTQFHMTSNEAQELKGAQLSMKFQISATHSGTEASPSKLFPVTLTPGNNDQDGPVSDVALANKGQGVGNLWLYGCSDDDKIQVDVPTGTKPPDERDRSVSLYVPGIAPKISQQKYITRLRWILADTPV